MDVCDVTKQYTEQLASQRLSLQKSKVRRGQRPDDRRSTEEAYNKFMLDLMFRGATQGKHMIHSSFIPPAYRPCTTSVTELRRVVIADLQLETHHRGTYILLRSITPPRRMTGILTLMEDEKGDVVLLQLYQQEDEDTRAATNIVNVGTILLVKEPYFKVMGDGDYGLRVDHLSDVVHINKDSNKIPQKWQPRFTELGQTAESLKLNGNMAMGDARYQDAITEYSYALCQPATQDEIDTIKRNRSLAFLKSRQFDAALSDTGFPQFNSHPPEKTLFRAAESLYYLERYCESCEVLELLCTNFPSNDQAITALGRARSRVLEQKTGKYNFKQLQAKAKKLRTPHLDHATYTGPVEIKETKSKGRGLFVTRSVKAGDLLFCEKAFSSAYTSDGTEGSKTTVLLNTETNTGFLGGQADLRKLIVQKLFRNPSLAPAFTALFHGTYKAAATHIVDAEPIVDTFLVERIISFNVFGCPVTSLLSYKDSLVKETSAEKRHQSCGIWIQASYINHSCFSNASRAFIGDMMVVRASRDLELGTEITFSYQSPTGVDMKALQGKLKHWGFVCNCTLCLDFKATKSSVLEERRKLMDSLKRAFKDKKGIQVTKAEQLLDKMSRTYTRPAEEAPRLLLWNPQLALTRVYAAQNKVIETVESAGKVLASLGFIVIGADSSPTHFSVVKWGLMMDHLAETFLLARDAFAAMGAHEDSLCAENYARTAYKIVIGEDTTFDG